MIKKLIVYILVSVLVILSSCSLGGSRTEMLNKDSDDKKADARLESVIEALENEDEDALRVIFSKQALNDADNFDRTVDDLFGFISGKITSWERLDGPTVFESNKYGHVTKEVSSYYYINTDEQKYFFLLRDYPVDTDHPDNVGLYMLLVVKAEVEAKIYGSDQKILYDGNQKISHAGIYLPFM